jgi:isopentenyl-diphosphate delta-isomerase
VAAYALLTRCRIGDAPALALAPVATAPHHQRQGAGQAVVRAVLDAARARGEGPVVVLGHPDYYPRFGFEAASKHGIRTSFEVAEEALMVLALDGSRDVPRGTIRYPAAFRVSAGGADMPDGHRSTDKPLLYGRLSGAQGPSTGRPQGRGPMRRTVMPITPATAATSASSGTSPAILLELVDEEGNTIGTAEKLAAHQPPGQLHRAFSVFLFDERGRLLLQRRALGKYHSPGVWSNSCCGHPYPGEAPFAAAARRAYEELGVSPSLLAEAGTVRYHHPDPESGLVEQEFNHLFVGMVQSPLRPDPEEIGETAFVTPDELTELHGSAPFSAWFMTVLDAARPAVRELTGPAGW